MDGDLIIGDLVCTESDPTPRQVDWIRTGEVGLFWNKVVTPSCLVPISLTEEILEKNRFVKEYGVCVIYRHPYFKWFVLYKKEFGYAISVTESEVNIEYVHELQHVLKLCGIEKTIEL